MTTLTWDSRIAALGKSADKLEKALGVRTVGELLGAYPRSYIAKGAVSTLPTLSPGDFLTCVGRVAACKLFEYRDRRTGRPAWRLEVHVATEGARLAMTFFDRNKGTATWREQTLKVGTIALFSGKLSVFRDDWQLTNPQTHTFGDAHSAVEAADAIPELIPIYRTSGKVQSWDIGDAVRLALDLVEDIPDALPESVRRAHDLVDIRTALRGIHSPESYAQKTVAEKRLKFEEAFITQMVLARRRLLLAQTPGTPRSGGHGDLLARFDERLPFTLTDGQREVTDEILDELAREHPMHRLLQGEVGSGKTLVALRSMLRVVDSGAQAVLLAPTEVLAQQHLRSIGAMLGDLGRGGQLDAAEGATGIALLTGSLSTAARRQALLDAASGDAGIVIGTHALLEDKVSFFDLGLVVVDEQHRFGVEQRNALTAKAATPPHVLVMTATPIPRTVAMTVFGDLDTSTLSELPAGRGNVQTNVVPTKAQPAWLERAWQRIAEEVAKGRQAYVVCARIGDEPPPEEGPELHSVEEMAPMLAAGPLAGLSVAALHGRMSPDDKDAVMRAFAVGETDVLVSTTVIEVGVDVPNASVMVILDADRFGVSQLHQLRGRIGRGGHDGLCLLVTDADPDGPSMERLIAVAGSRDGFELSRIDLEQRREGNVLGTEQSGSRKTLKLLSVLTDEEVIADAREAATACLADDPELTHSPALAAAVRELEDSQDAAYLEMS